MVFPFGKLVDLSISALAVKINDAANSSNTKGAISKFSAMETVAMADLPKPIKDSIMSEIYRFSTSRINHHEVKTIVKKEIARAQQEEVQRSALTLTLADASNSAYANQYGVYNQTAPMNEFNNAAVGSIVSDLINGGLAWLNHVIRWVVLLTCQMSAMILLYLMPLAHILSFLPFFSGLLKDFIFAFAGLKAVLIVMILIDLVVDTLNIYNLTLNAVGADVTEIAMTAAGYSIVKITLTVSAIGTGMMLFKAKNAGFNSSVDKGANQAGGAMNAVKGAAMSLLTGSKK